MMDCTSPSLFSAPKKHIEEKIVIILPAECYDESFQIINTIDSFAWLLNRRPLYFVDALATTIGMKASIDQPPYMGQIYYI